MTDGEPAGDRPDTAQRRRRPATGRSSNPGASGGPSPGRSGGPGRGRNSDRARARHAARRLALASVFEAEFGQRTAGAILERHLAASENDPETAAYARELVSSVVARRDEIDARIEREAPRYPVVQLARMDRALLRTGICEVLHSRTTPARVAIAEWVELARIYSGDPARRLVNGVLGRVATESVTEPERPGPEEPGRSRGR